MARIKYQKELDGLRALAVLAVIATHAGLSGFSGGFVGVDVFFVISGYLISALLMRSTLQRALSIFGYSSGDEFVVYYLRSW